MLKVLPRLISNHFYKIVYFFLFLIAIPAIWYSLRTPFALIDDHDSWSGLVLLSKGQFNYLSTIWFASNRFRPLFELYNLITWFVLRESFTLHHLVRLVIKLSAGICTYQILKQWFPATPKKFYLSGFVFCCLFFFWPNNPEARLAPQETLIVFFLSLLLWFYSLALKKHQGDISATPGLYAGVLIAYALLGGTKEPAIAFEFVFLLLFVCQGMRSYRRILFLIPFGLLFSFNLVRTITIELNGGYGVAEITVGLINENLQWLVSGVFFNQINWVIFCFLLSSILILIGKIYKESYKQHLAVSADPSQLNWFLLSVAASFLVYSLLMFIVAANALRYLFPLVYLLSIMTAAAAAFLQETNRSRRIVVSALSIGMSVYFIWVNYSSFIYQYAVQYYDRRMEAHLLDKLTDTLDAGSSVYITINSEYETNIANYFNNYCPYFRGVKYPNFQAVSLGNLQGAEGYFAIRHKIDLDGYQLVDELITPGTTPFLEQVRRISSLAPLGPTPDFSDAGATPLGKLKWFIYENKTPKTDIGSVK
jgi:hypothetical protein